MLENETLYHKYILIMAAQIDPNERNVTIEDVGCGMVKITNPSGASITLKKAEAALLNGAIAFIENSDLSDKSAPNEKLLFG